MSVKVSDVIEAIEQLAPLAWQEEWDNAGVQVGDISQPLTGIVLCVDATEEVLDTAIAKGYNLIVAHHPLLFHPLHTIQGQTYIERCVIKACKYDIVVYAAHTNLDNAPGGVNFCLAQKIGLGDVRVLDVKKGILAPGGETVGLGVVGNLPQPLAPGQFMENLHALFGRQSIPYAPGTGNPVSSIAVCGGSGASLRQAAIDAGADVLLTGEARYNDYLDVAGKLMLVTLGHFETELCTIEIFYEAIRKKFITFEPHIVCVNSNPVKYI